MSGSFLEKVGVLFASSVYIEGIIKDLIVFKKNPQYIEEFNKWNIVDGLSLERKKYAKLSFNQKIVDEFVNLYWLDKSEEKFYTVILLLRDIFWHSRIWIEDEKIWYCPSTENKLNKIIEIFQIKNVNDGDIITISQENLNFDSRIKWIEHIDNKVLRELAESIWLDYSLIR